VLGDLVQSGRSVQHVSSFPGHLGLSFLPFDRRCLSGARFRCERRSGGRFQLTFRYSRYFVGTRCTNGAGYLPFGKHLLRKRARC